MKLELQFRFAITSAPRTSALAKSEYILSPLVITNSIFLIPFSSKYFLALYSGVIEGIGAESFTNLFDAPYYTWSGINCFSMKYNLFKPVLQNIKSRLISQYNV